MSTIPGSHLWLGTDGYEAYMGRWSRPIALRFLTWFDAPKAGRWLDVGCGTGALTEAVLAVSEPAGVLGVDPSADFVATACEGHPDPRARFEVGDARQLPVESNSFDAVVAGLVLNFVPEPATAAREMVRAARPAGFVGAYVWDYSGEMQIVRYFWEAVWATDVDAAEHDPRSQFKICQPEPLAALFRNSGLSNVEVGPIDMTMVFRDFDDFWLPHLMTGPSLAQRYVAKLDDTRRTQLKEQLRSMLPISPDGSIALIARAWAVSGVV